MTPTGPPHSIFVDTPIEYTYANREEDDHDDLLSFAFDDLNEAHAYVRDRYYELMDEATIPDAVIRRFMPVPVELDDGLNELIKEAKKKYPKQSILALASAYIGRLDEIASVYAI